MRRWAPWRETPVLRHVLPKGYARPTLDKRQLGNLIDLFTNLDVRGKEHRSRDVLDQVYEYCLAKFANAEGKQGGEFYTFAPIVAVLVAVLSGRRRCMETGPS